MLKWLEIMYQNEIYISIFDYSKICCFPVEKCKTQGVCYVIYIFLWSSLGQK